MFATAAQRVRRARERFDLDESDPAIMTMPLAEFTLGGHATAAATRSAGARGRIVEHLGLDREALVTDRPCGVAVQGHRVLFLPLNHSNSDFADPIEVDRRGLTLRWWNSGGRMAESCRLWFTAADGRWQIVDVPRRAMFMPSKFAVGLDDLIAALDGQEQDPAPDADA